MAAFLCFGANKYLGLWIQEASIQKTSWCTFTCVNKQLNFFSREASIDHILLASEKWYNISVVMFCVFRFVNWILHVAQPNYHLVQSKRGS